VSDFDSSLKKRDQQLSKLNDLVTSKDKQIAQLNDRVAQLNSDLEFQLSIERDERARLSEQLDQVKAGSNSSELDGRIATIEDRLRSIDSSRQSVNAELLNIKQQLNTLLLEGAIR
jgi:predicted  nucleic acid-binding Zn-ribbon protein